MTDQPTKRFVTTAITGSGASKWSEDDDLEKAIRLVLDATNELIFDNAPAENPFVLQIRDMWDNRNEVFTIDRRTARNMLAPGIVWPASHEKVEVRTKDMSDEDNPIVGVFRARIVSKDNPGFDPEGKSIWITAIFEHFIDIEDIVSLECFGV